MLEELREKIQNLTKPVFQQSQVEVFEFNLRQSSGTIIVEYLVDKSYGGIDLQECSALNKRIIQIFEEEKVFTQDYLLEVSSPGVDRPILTGKDFRRVLKRAVTIFLSDPIENQYEFRGIVQAVSEEDVLMSSDFKEWKIPLRLVKKAKQI